MPKVTREHFDRRKDEILHAALTIFKEKGFELTTMTDIINATQLSRGGVYRYFSSTEEIMREYLRRDMASEINDVKDLAAKHDTAWDAVMEYIKDIEQNLDDRTGMVIYEYFLSGWRNSRRKKFLIDRYQKGKASLLYLFEAGTKTGEFTPLQPLDTIVSFSINVFDGLFLEAQLSGKSSVDVTGQLKALIFYFQHVLRVRPRN